MGKYFGTDGFRGEANKNLTVEHAYQVGRFLGWYYGKEHPCKVVIGKDTRRSGYMLEAALVAGLTASGADAYLLHVTTTPSVAYIVRTEGFDCGIMISASHNPYYDNGIKVINGQGEKLTDDVIEEIEAYLDGRMGELPLAGREKIGASHDYAEGREKYVSFLLGLVKESFQGKKIGLDCANGSAFALAPKIFKALGAEIFVINQEPDGININEQAGSTHIQGLCRFVKENHLDAGFAYDGDADRCLAVNEKGQVVDGDQILYICGCHMRKQGLLDNDTIVTTIMSNLGLYKALDRAGISYEKTAVGDKYVYENMARYGHRLGGEQSGHIIFSHNATTGDGILTSLKLMEAMLEQKKTLSELSQDMTVYPQVLKNVRVVSKPLALEDPDVRAAVESAGAALGEEGRILVRQSGTEPVIRVMVEAGTTELCEKYVEQVIAVLKEKGHVAGDK